MIQTMTFSDFVDAFREAGREDQFSYNGKRALFEYFNELWDADYELDVVGVCCTFSEYTVEELQSYFDIGEFLYEDDDPDDIDSWEKAMCDHTTVIPVYKTTVIPVYKDRLILEDF